MGTAIPTPSVTVSEARLRVINWETAEPEIVRYFEARAPSGGDDSTLATVLERALKAGVLALEAVGVSVNVDYVEKEFQALTNQIDSYWGQRVQEINASLEKVFADEGGALPNALERYLGEGGRLEELFDPERRDSAVGRIKEIMREHFEGEGSTLYRLLDFSNTDSPLRKWREELDKKFENLRRLIDDYRAEVKGQVLEDKTRAEMLEKSTLKGRDYEDLVFDNVNEIAGIFGDAAEATGDQPGIGGSKVGDIVVTLNPRDTKGAPLRLVIEAKDKAVGQTPILRELDEAVDNREAAAAIAVYSRAEHMPTGTAPFRDQGKSRYLCLLDKESPSDTMSLQMAYRVARFWALADMRPDVGVVDTRGISEDLDAARGRLKTFTSLKTQLTKVKSSVDQGVEALERDLEELRKELENIFERIDGRISIAGGDPDPSVKTV